MGRYVIKPSKSGMHFVLQSGNYQVIGTSEVYKAKAACLNGIKSIGTYAKTAKIEDQTLQNVKAEKGAKFVIFLDKAGEYRFRLLASNGEIILASEGYKSKSSCKNGIASVKKNAKSKVVEAE